MPQGTPQPSPVFSRMEPPTLPSFAGRYSLSFIYTGQSKPRPGSPSFQAVIFLNDQPFFRYDSTHGRAEPLGPWAALEGLEDWEKESQLQKARGDYFLLTLEDAINYYKDAQGKWRTAGACMGALKVLWGCCKGLPGTWVQVCTHGRDNKGRAKGQP